MPDPPNLGNGDQLLSRQTNRTRLAVLGVAAIAVLAGIFIVASDVTSALTTSKIQHVVIIVKENRSFDNLFGRFPGADGATYAQEGNRLVQMERLPSSSSTTSAMAIVARDRPKTRAR